MVEVDGNHVNQVENFFNEFWCKLSSSGGCPLNLASVSGIEGSNPQEWEDSYLQIKIDEDTDGQHNSLWIKDVPEGPKSPNKIDVRIQFKQKIEVLEEDEETNYEIVRSKVRVQYIREGEDEDSGEVFGGYHFDYKRDQDSNHPLFHAQFKPYSIRDGVSERKYEVAEDDKWSSIPDFPRVPCAPIELAAAVFLVLKDHRPEVINESNGSYDWPSRVEDQVKSLPHFSEESFEGLLSGDKLIADWWYNHDNENNDHEMHLGSLR